MIVDLFLLYQFIKRIATPFNEWKAYELGIIDEKGNILKSSKERVTVKERDAFGKFDLLVLKLKKILEKIPGGQTRIGSYAAALWLIKEHNENVNNLENLNEESIQQYMEIAENMSAGSGMIAGIGQGPDGEPGLTASQMKRYKSKNKKSARAQFIDNWRK